MSRTVHPRFPPFPNQYNSPHQHRPSRAAPTHDISAKKGPPLAFHDDLRLASGVIAAALVLVVCYFGSRRLLADGACEGGTPEAFYFRRRERARARKARQVAKAREAIARVAQIRARNAAIISTSRSGGAQGSPIPLPPATAATAAVIDATAVDSGGQGAGMAIAERGPVTASDGSVTLGGFSVAAPSDDETRTEACIGSTFADSGSTGADKKCGDDSATATPSVAVSNERGFQPGGGTEIENTNGDTSDDHGKVNAPSSAFDISKWMPDEDVRRYEQDFRGLRSAYSTYSSVFSSQVCTPCVRHVL